MTQITTTTQKGDIVVIVPGWVIRAVGFLSLFIGLSTSFIAFAIGYVTEGVLFAVVLLALVPIGLLIQYLMWRFYWYLILIGLIFQSLCGVLTLIGTTGFLVRMPPSVANSPYGSTVSALGDLSPASVLIACLSAALITASLWRFYNLWRSDAKMKRVTQSPAGDSFDFDVPEPTVSSSLMGRVLRKLETTGSKGEIKGDTIHVYKSGRFIGIVRVVDRAGGAISPVILNDVVKQRDRLGVKVAYLATSGMFTADVRNMADQQGVKLMTV